MANEFYEINVLDYGADPTGGNDSTLAFQSAVNDAIVLGYNRIYVPMALGQIYLISGTIIINTSNFYVFGDAALMRQKESPLTYNGYLRKPPFITNPIYFEVQINSSVQNNNGPIVFEGISFWYNGPWDPNSPDTIAIKLNIDQNVPASPVFIDKCSGFGIDKFLLIDNGSTQATDISFLKFIDCNLNGCNYSVYASTPIFGLNICNNQIEQGARIRGIIGGICSLNDNNFEGENNYNLLTIENHLASPINLLFENNYVEMIDGEYMILAQNTGNDSIINIGNQHSEQTLKCIDPYKLEGINKIVLKPELQRNSTIVNTNDMRLYSSITLNQNNDIFSGNPKIAILQPGSSLKGRQFYTNILEKEDPSTCFINTFLPHAEYTCYSPNYWAGNVFPNFGNVPLLTPYGNYNGLSVSYQYNMPLLNLGFNSFFLTPNNGIVLCLLIRLRNININETVQPIVNIFSPNGPLIQSVKSTDFTYSNNDVWYLQTIVITNNIDDINITSININFDLDSNLGINSIAEYDISNIGIYCSYQNRSFIKTFNNNTITVNQILVTPFVPLFM